MDIVCSKCGEAKPPSEFHKNGVGRRRGSCKLCEKARDRARYDAKNPDPERAARRSFIRENGPPIRTPETEKERFQAWKAANPENERQRQRRYLEKNREKVRAKWGKRRADKLRATPSWADLKAIEAFYAEAARLTAETGQAHHVDHIVPLRGKTVCGLHVPWNLRVIPAAENLSKLNRLDPVDGPPYF